MASGTTWRTATFRRSQRTTAVVLRYGPVEGEADLELGGRSVKGPGDRTGPGDEELGDGVPSGSGGPIWAAVDSVPGRTEGPLGALGLSQKTDGVAIAPPVRAGSVSEARASASRISIVIPTLNENGNVAKLIQSLESLLPEEPEVIVVDDNSSDGTVQSLLVLRERFPRIQVLQRGDRRGIGSAVRDGIRYALEHTPCDYVVTMDADGSHDPHQLPELLLAAREADYVQGSRYVEGGRIEGWPPFRRLLSIVGNRACRVLFRTGFYEHTTFFRVFHRKCAERIVDTVVDDGYAWGVRSLLEALRAGFTTREVPITFEERTVGESKLGFREVAGWIVSVARIFLEKR